MRYAIDGKYPIETKDQLTKTAAYFDKYLVRFHPKDRVKIAATMEKRSSELGTYLNNPWLKNYSRALNDNPSISPDFNKNIEMRKQACNGVKFKETKAEEFLEKISNTKEQSAKQIVDLLFDFDKIANLEYQWDKTIVDPIMTVFGSLNNPEYDAVKIAGNVTDYQLKKIASDEQFLAKLPSLMGKSFQSNFSKDPINTVQHLGSIEKTAFCKIIES